MQMVILHSTLLYFTLGIIADVGVNVLFKKTWLSKELQCYVEFKPSSCDDFFILFQVKCRTLLLKIQTNAMVITIIIRTVLSRIWRPDQVFVIVVNIL